MRTKRPRKEYHVFVVTARMLALSAPSVNKGKLDDGASEESGAVCTGMIAL